MSSENPEPKQSPDPKTLNDPEPEKPSEEGAPKEGSEENEEEEEEMCGFCLFMRGGGCKENFVNWENCIKDAEENNEDIVEKCFQATSALKICMEAHADYYDPILRAEKRAEEAVAKELEEEKQKEKEKENSEDLEKKTEG